MDSPVALDLAAILERADGMGVPLGLTVILALASPVVAIVALVAAEVRDRRRLSHERKMKETEIEAGLATRLRDERIAAYRKLLAATSGAHVDREKVAALAEAYAEISLLAGSDELDRAAARVWVEYGETEKVASKKVEDWAPNEDHAADFAQALHRANVARDRFLDLDREELRVKGRPEGFRDLEAPLPPETPSQAQTREPRVSEPNLPC